MTATLQQPLVVELPVPPPPPVSWEAFLDWLDEDIRAEWVDGEIILMDSPVALSHQFLSGFLYKLLDAFVEAHDLGFVLLAPTLMRLETRPSGREPDLLFVASEHSDRLRETYVDGPADLVVEISSPGSDAQDRGDKFLEYEAGGVSEYWLIDPVRQDAVFYQRGPDAHYHPAPIEDGIYRSAVLAGFRLRVEWLWQRPLPSVPELMREFG